MNIPLQHIMFIDIETVPLCQSYDMLSDDYKKFWERKSSFFRAETETAADVYQRAGIYAEFGKIVCISVGVMVERSGVKKFRQKSFAGDDEKSLLLDFAKMITDFSPKGDKVFCGHNIREFDMPYISRRMLIHGIPLPPMLDMQGKKPWDINHIDTLDLWKFGDYKNYTSLDLLTHLFDIPTPKDDIDGSQVARVYYEEKDLNRIVTYCDKDVLSVARLYMKFRMMPGISDELVEKA